MGEKIYFGFDKMKSIKKCEICGSNKISYIFRQYDKNLNIKDYFSVFKCYNCNALLLNPQPTNKELKKYYSKDKYYSLKKIETKESKKTKLKLFLYNIYFDPNRNNLLLKFIFSPFKFLIRGTQIVERKKLLDIGCGSGQFIYEMKNLGIEVYGLEPGEFDKEGNRRYGLNIIKGEIQNVEDKKEFFDIITLNHVLEHLDNPNQALKKINHILRKDGLFIMGVPNTNSWAFKIFKKNWYQLDVPRHLWNYSYRNIRIILEKNGFGIKKIRYNSRPSQFSVSLMYKLNIRNKGLNKILNLLFLPLTWMVNFMRIGDQIEVWCVKTK